MPIARSAGVATRFALLVLAATLCSNLLAQTVSSTALAALKPVPQANRIAANADLGPQTHLSGTLPGWVQPSAQVAQSVDLTTPLHLFVFLQRDPAVEASFTQFLADQQNPSSPLYHQWLTPQQVGEFFGPTQSDVAAVTSRLSVQGLTVTSVSPSRVVIEVTGSAASVANAFHVNFAYYSFAGKPRLSSDSDPSIPSALTPLIASIGGLSEVVRLPQSSRKIVIPPPTAAVAQTASPLYTYSSTEHFLMPKDFSLIYDINPVHSAGNTGAKIGAATQHVAIMGQSRVAASDITNFASISAIGSSYTLNTIIPPAGVDPGVTNSGDQDEQTLDVDRVIGTATGVTVDLVVSSTGNGGGGIGTAIDYEVNTLVDPIMSISYGDCEVSAGSASTKANDNFFAAAAAEGITTLISSGDSGVDACGGSFAAPTGTQSAGINGLCSSGYVTCVGGTEFNDASNYSLYWASSNGAGQESALSYIPEGVWNEPTTDETSTGYWLSASGGGPSLYISKPSWQTGTGVPADGARDTPDVAFSAAGHDGYFACLDYSIPAGNGSCTSGSFVSFEGTSAAAPGMAGIVALLNTSLGKAQGNVNPLLYSLAASHPSAFHDTTIATSGVTGCVATTPSMCNNSTPAAASLTGGLAGYTLTTGYDQATGLGSLDVANFLTAAATSTVSTTLTLTASPNPATTSQAVTLTATLTPGTSSSTPTGSVQFYSNNVAIGPAATISSNIATFTDTFTTVGTYNITAVYSGDTNFAPSTATAVPLVVNVPAFTVTPATTTYTLISGATTGNTDVVTVASTTSFAGSVTLGCTITTASGTAAGSCTILPAIATLTAGSSSRSTLTIATTPGTSGVLNVKLTGTSGSTVVSSANIAVSLTAASFSLSASPTSLSFTSGATTGNTDTITVTSINGFAGSVTLTCVPSSSSAVFPPSCSASPTSVTLTAGGTGTSIITIGSTTAQANVTIQKVGLERSWTLGGGVALAMLFFLPAFRRRRSFGSLLAVALMALGAVSLSGCGNGGAAPATPATPKSSAGTYTVTVTATGTTAGATVAATPATATFSVVIN